MNKEDVIEKGSKTAKAGFQNEKDVVKTFNNWATDELAREWLAAMGYDPDDIDNVAAKLVKGHFKADVQVEIKTKNKETTDCQNIQVKLVSNSTGFNQIDKRWLDKYSEMWNMPNDVLKILRHYTGEQKPYKSGTRDSRRMFLDEMQELSVRDLVDWFTNNQNLIVKDILGGRGEFCAKWILVIRKSNKFDWVLLPMDVAIEYYGTGDVTITQQGNLKIAKITVQRKGGDNGRETAKMLQFKLDPTELFTLKSDT